MGGGQKIRIFKYGPLADKSSEAWTGPRETEVEEVERDCH